MFLHIKMQGFPWEVDQWGGGWIFNNRLSFENNRILFFLLFSGNFRGGQGLDGGGQSCDGGSPSPPLGKTLGY